MSDLIHIAADTLPVWRDAALIVLSLVVIGCIWIATGIVDR